MQNIGLSATSAYFNYEKDALNFLKKREYLAKQVAVKFNLNQDFDESSINKLNRLLGQGEISEFEVQKYFLNILAYCGEYMCKKVKGNWKIVYDDYSEKSWYPVIEAEKMCYDVFRDFYEELVEPFGYEEGIPTIILQDSVPFVEEKLSKKEIYRNNGLTHPPESFFEIVEGENIPSLLKHKVKQLVVKELSSNFPVWLLDTQQILLINQNKPNGILFDSLEDFEQFNLIYSP